MKSVKDSKTEKNLLTAFAGESQARNRYTIFAKKAKKDGYIFVRDIFLETADQEKEHAERLWGFLDGGGETEITGTFPSGITGETVVNLGEAAAGEHFEWETMYPTMAKTAEEEGFKEIAAVMRSIAVAEKFHEKRYLELQKWIEENKMFKTKEEVEWRCLNCGYVHKGTEPPAMCPACRHPASYFVSMDLHF